MIAWILDRAKERPTWMEIFLLAGAIGLVVTPEHKELIATATAAVVAAIAALTATNPPPNNDRLAVFISRGIAQSGAPSFFIHGAAKSCAQQKFGGQGVREDRSSGNCCSCSLPP